MPPPSSLDLRAEDWQIMVDHALAARPNEACGLLATVGSRVTRVFPGTNTEFSPTRYNMDPGEVIAALDEMRQQGWQLGAIFHSHPRSAAVPSATDLRLAYYPDALMVIISLAGAAPEVRAYRVLPDGRRYEAVRLTVDGQESE